MAFQAQKQEPAWTPQPGRADMHFLGSVQCLKHGEPRASQELPGMSHLYQTVSISLEVQFAGEKPWHSRHSRRKAQRQGRSRATDFNVTNHIARSHPACVLMSFQQSRGFTLQKGLRTTVTDMTTGKNLLQSLTTKSPCLAGCSSYLDALQLRSGCSAGQNTPQLQTQQSLPSLEKHNQRQPRCFEKVRDDRESLAQEAAFPD